MAQEKRVLIAMRSSSELAAKMAMSTKLSKTRSLFSVDSIVAGVGAVKRFLDVEQMCVVSTKE